MSDKPIVLELGEVRIIRFNEMNLAVERHEEVFIPTKKRKEIRWVFHGYASTILDALRLISRKELLVNETQLSNLNDYVKQVKQSNNKLIKIIKENDQL